MKRNILIEHKEAIIVCEESGYVSMSYNVLVTTPEANVRVKFLILAMSTKSALTCTNCGNISHSMKACHNKKKKGPTVPTIIVKSIDPIARTKTQLVKSRKIH